MEIFYFGKRYKHSGHHLYSSRGMVYDRDLPNDFPCPPYALDGGFLPPKRPQREGRAHLVHFTGWTVLAFWDRSGDSRRNSGSSFIVRGHHGFNEVITKTKKAFPEIWERIDFDIYLSEV